MTRPIIIGGCGRSGTTLLRVMLDCHAEVMCGPESSILTGDYSLRRVASYYDERPMRLAVERQILPPRQFVSSFFHRQARKAGKSRWAEKTPSNVRHLPRIFGMFPEAQFVHVIRDGRDVACSLRNHPPGETNPITVCIARWIVDVHAGLRWRDDPRYTEVYYEDLVDDPERELRRLLGFLDVPWDAAVLRHSERDHDVTRFAAAANAAEPISDASVGRWRRDLPARELQAVEAVAADLLSDLGYAVS